MALRRISCDTSEPITLAEAKAHLYVDDTYKDDYISALITVAREKAENMCNRSFVRQQWQLTMDDFPDGAIILEKASPLATEATAVLVTYYNTSVALTTMASTDYVVDERSEPAIIVTSTALGGDWPDTNEQLNAVTVTYFTGLASATDTPAPVKQWMKIRIAQMYEFREPILPDRSQMAIMPRDFVDGLLDEYMLPKIY